MATHHVSIELQNLPDGMHFLADTGDDIEVNIDSDPGVGGLNRGVRPQKLLLASLASCTGMDVISILRKKRQAVSAFSVSVAGEKADEHPKVYTKIDVTYHVTGINVDPAAVERAIELSMEKYCPVANMLKEVVPIETHYKITASAAQ